MRTRILLRSVVVITLMLWSGLGWGQIDFSMTLTNLNNGTSVTTKTYAPSFNPNTPDFATSPSNFSQSGGMLHAATDDASGYVNWAGWDVQSRFFYFLGFQ